MTPGIIPKSTRSFSRGVVVANCIMAWVAIIASLVGREQRGFSARRVALSGAEVRVR